MNRAQVYAKHIAARISPKKIGQVTDLIRGKGLQDAKVALTFDPTKGAEMLLKVLKSAEANAKNNAKLDIASLYVADVWIGPGPMAKRGRIVAKSRISPILKRTSHIYVGLSERKK